MTCTAPRHGTWVAAQKFACSCPVAVEALRVYRKRHREGRLEPLLVDVLGSQRRLRALMAIGYAERKLAAELGWTLRMVNGVVIGEHKTIRVSKACAVADLYERLCGTAGDSQRTRGWAQRRGWLPPLAWDDIDDPAEVPSLTQVDDEVDEVAVTRACRSGVSSVPLTDSERAEVKRRLLESKAPAHEVAVLLEVNVRSVDRWRSQKRPGLEAA